MTRYYVYSDELYHHGVKGMKWGVRKKELKNTLWSKQDKAEDAHEKRQIALNKKYKQYGNNFEGKNTKLKGTKKKAYSSASQANWDRYVDEMADAKKEYKSGVKALKKERKASYKSAQAEVKKSWAKKDNFIYSKDVKKRAAKLVSDNDLPVSEAISKAKKEALIYTGIATAAYGALTVAQLIK